MSAAIIALTSMNNQQAIARSKRNKEKADAECRDAMLGYSHNPADVTAMQGYAQCVQRFHPQHDAGGYAGVGLCLLIGLLGYGTGKLFEMSRRL